MTQEKYILYKKALAELYVINTYMKQEVKDKIPEELKLSINRNKDKNYSFEYDITLTLDKQNLLLETKALLSVIYTEYLCSTEEKSKWDEYDRFYIQNQERLKKENYKEENIFEKRKNEKRKNEKEQSLIIIENKKENKLKKFLKMIFYKINR